MKCENKLGGRGFTYGYRTFGRLKVFFSNGKAITVKLCGELLWERTMPGAYFPKYLFGYKVR